MPHVAILITGRIKNSWQYGLHNTKKYIIKNNTVVFASTYSLDDDITDIQQFANEYKVAKINIEQLIVDDHPVFNQLHPFMELFYQRAWPEDLKMIQNGSIYRCASMFFHNYRAFELMKDYEREKNIKFDYVIKWRADNVPEMELNLKSLESLEDIIITPSELIYDSIICPDHIAIGHRNSMEIYCCIFNKLKWYYDEYYIDLFKSEYTLHRILELEGLKHEYIYFKYKQTKCYDKTHTDYKELNEEHNLIIKELTKTC